MNTSRTGNDVNLDTSSDTEAELSLEELETIFGGSGMVGAPVPAPSKKLKNNANTNANTNSGSTVIAEPYSPPMYIPNIPSEPLYDPGIYSGPIDLAPSGPTFPDGGGGY